MSFCNLPAQCWAKIQQLALIESLKRGQKACSCVSRYHCKRIALALSCVREGCDLLGEKLPDVPQEVHQEALELLKHGVIQRTTAKQRARNYLSTKYEGPEEFASMFRYGYASRRYRWSPKHHRVERNPKGGIIIRFVGGR